MKGFNYLIIFILIFIPFHAVHVLNKSSFFKTNYVEQLSGSSFDYIILGSSRSLTSLNTNQIDSLLSLNGFNASLDDQNIVGSAMMLEHLLANDIEFKVCVLSLDNGDYERGLDIASANSYRWFSLVKRKYIAEYYERFDDLSSKVMVASKIWPGFAFWHNNKKLVPAYLLSYLNERYHHKYDQRGNFSYPVLSGKRLSGRHSKKIMLVGKSGAAIQRIQSICAENEIDLIVYIPPYLDAELELSQSGNIINHSSLFFGADSLFYDRTHVNSVGRKLTSDHFAFDLSRFGLFAKKYSSADSRD